MANPYPLKNDIAITIRVDKEFIRRVDAMRKALDPMPSKSEMIRRAIFETFERGQSKSGGKRNGR